MSVDGIWYVKLADGDVERVTLDQLDEAFQSGQIDEGCMVLADGADQWTKLGDLLGLSEASAPPAAPAIHTGAHVQQPVSTQSPFALQHPAARAAVVTAPPVAAHAPVSMRPVPLTPPVPVVGSVRPVTFDVGTQLAVDEDLEYPAPSRKRWVVGALGAVVVGAGAFFVVARTVSSAPSPAAPVFVAAAVEPPTAPQVPPQAATPVLPSSPHATNGGSSSVTDPTQQRLTDEQKRKLLEAEKSSKLHTKSHGGGGSYHPKEKSTGFTTDGNKFDPLNSSL